MLNFHPPGMARLSVFEVANEARRELYIGSTPLGFDAWEAELRRRPPSAIAHWRPEEKRSARFVESGLDPTQAAEFARGYAATFRESGWAVIAEG